LIKLLEQARAVAGLPASYLFEAGGLGVSEQIRLPGQLFEAMADVILRELEDLARAAMAVRDLTEGERGLGCVALVPEIVQAE